VALDRRHVGDQPLTTREADLDREQVDRP
jgi:hypothetical protein